MPGEPPQKTRKISVVLFECSSSKFDPPCLFKKNYDSAYILAQTFISANTLFAFKLPMFCLYVRTRVSSKQTKINFGSNRNKPKQDLFRVCFVKPKRKNFGLFRCFEPISNNRNKQICFVTNRNNPKFLEKFPNI
jgi:hypothetical protein